VRLAGALLLAEALALPAAAVTAPEAPGLRALDAKAAEWSAKGYLLKDRASRRFGEQILAAAVYTPVQGSGGDRLEAYVVYKGKAYLGFSHPSTADRLELDTTPEGRDFKDLLGDGSRAVAYHAVIPALDAGTLEILRYKRFKFKLVAGFPEGRFVQDDGVPLILSRDLPLGRYLAVGCEDFGTISQTAFRTRLYAARRGRFVDVSRRHPKIYREEIARKEAALARLGADLRKNAGEYLGLALSVYYDYAALGRPEEGWARQKEFFRVPAGAPAGVRKCFDSMRRSLAGKLGVPAGAR
jgi:hypothetical protein